LSSRVGSGADFEPEDHVAREVSYEDLMLAERDVMSMIERGESDNEIYAREVEDELNAREILMEMLQPLVRRDPRCDQCGRRHPKGKCPQDDSGDKKQRCNMCGKKGHTEQRCKGLGIS
jgi:tRNA(Ile2) C34 agmatinyltransferase TiaS